MLIFILMMVLLTSIGSFLTVVGLRIPQKQSLLFPRSRCPKCYQSLTFIDLIPILSFLFFRGKCRYCKQKISPMYPLSEFLFVCSVLLVLSRSEWDYHLFSTLGVLILLHPLVISDLRYKIVPNVILLLGFMYFISLKLYSPLISWTESILVGAIFLILLGFFAWLTGAMGGGDIKLFGLIGFSVGLTDTVSIFLIAVGFASLFALIAIPSRWIQRREPIPFVPFIWLGAITTYLF